MRWSGAVRRADGFDVETEVRPFRLTDGYNHPLVLFELSSDDI